MFDAKTYLQERLADLREYRGRRVVDLEGILVRNGSVLLADIELPEIDYQIGVYQKTLRDMS